MTFDSRCPESWAARENFEGGSLHKSRGGFALGLRKKTDLNAELRLS